MIGKKINQLATELAPESTDLTIIGDPTTGVSKKITIAQLGAIFSGAVSFYNDLASFPVSGDINVIYCAKDTQKLYLWSGSAYTEVFPSQALLDTYQLRSEKGNANGYASLDSGGKVPISQLPSSIMEYKGTWNAATNTPTLANGTGDTGDVYICNVAGTVNFGAGPITFAVGDYTIYSGSIWQRSSGAVGTVTSVAASITGDSVTISGSPVTTSGTLAFAFNGTTAQYIRGNGTLETFPSLTGFVPYTGATANVDLGTHTLIAAKGTFSSSGSGDTVGITHSSGSGIALNITKGGNGEGLYINKTSGSGNAATIIGTLNATTLVKSGGTSTQFLKADGSVDSSTYLTTSAASSTYLPLTGGTLTGVLSINSALRIKSGAANGVLLETYNTNQLVVRVTPSSTTYDSTLIFPSNSRNYTFPDASGTLALVGGSGVGTVTSVGALTIGTTGTDLSSTVANGTTTPVITLNVPTASATNRGALSSTDWTTFNNKQNALTNPVTGTGTNNYIPKFTTTGSTIGNSLLTDNGTNIGLGVANPTAGRLQINVSDTTTAAHLQIVDGTTTLANSFVTNFRNANDGNGRYSLSSWQVQNAVGNDQNGFIGVQSVSGAGAYTPNIVFGQRTGVSTYATRMTLDASGNLGLGVTPSAWGSSFRAFEILGGSIFSTSTQNIIYLQNAYNDGTGFKYITSDTASQYRQANGEHRWFNAPSGTAGNAITFTQAMTLNASGRLILGNTTDNTFSRLQVAGGAWIGQNAGRGLYFADGASYTSVVGVNQAVSSYNAIELRASGVDGQLFLATNGNVGIGSTTPDLYSFGGGGRFMTLYNSSGYSLLTVASSSTNSSGLSFGNESIRRASIDGLNGSDLAFATNGSNSGTTVTERMRITSGGNVLFNGGEANGWYAGFSNSFTNFAYMGATAQFANSGGTSTDFGIRSANALAFYTSGGSERMRITSGGYVLINTTTDSQTTGVGSKFVSNGRLYKVSSLSDNTQESLSMYSTTAAAFRFYVGWGGTIYATSTSISGISDISLKKNIRNLDKGLNSIMQLQPIKFDWINGDSINNMGFIAQEIEKIFPELVTEYRYNGKETKKSLKMGDLIPSMVKAIQELKQELDTLKNK